MFDVGFMELVLISVIGLLVLGPQRLPKVAAQIGKWVGRARRTATQLRRQLEREIELSELEELREKRTPPSAAPAEPVAPTKAPEPPASTDVASTSTEHPAAEAEPTIAPPAEREPAPDEPEELERHSAAGGWDKSQSR